MKTLDEVIKDFEDGTEHLSAMLISKETWSNALHYLKGYKNTDENYKKAIAHVTEVIDHYEKMVADYLAVNNGPLTWDELKGMEGKPVWVEIGDGSKGWVIIRKITDSGIVSGSDGFIGIDTAYGMDTTWQAYRKERE